MSFFKNIFFKKLLESKMKDVPPEQREQVLGMIEKNPDFFETVAKEIQDEIAKGKDQMAATMEVMGRHQDELKKIAGK